MSSNTYIHTYKKLVMYFHIYSRIYRKLNRLIPNLDDFKTGDIIVSENRWSVFSKRKCLRLDILYKNKNDKFTMIALSRCYKRRGIYIPKYIIEIVMFHDFAHAHGLIYRDRFGDQDIRSGSLFSNKFINKLLKIRPKIKLFKWKSADITSHPELEVHKENLEINNKRGF